MDMQRNLMNQVDDADAEEFEAFAPGWRKHIVASGDQRQIRVALLQYWERLVAGLGFTPRSAQLIRGSKGQRLYWLMLLARHSLADKFWRAILRAESAQGDFGF